MGMIRDEIREGLRLSGLVMKRIARLPLLVLGDGLAGVGEISTLLYRVFVRIPLARRNLDLTIKQMIGVGVTSIPLLFVTSIFTGGVAAVQSEYQFRNLVSDKFVGTAVMKMVLIELGPMLTALVMAGRVGSALAAEIGSMREKEEIDAMTCLDLDPLRYLAVPRLLAFLVMLPALTSISSFLALVGGWITCVLGLDITSYTYFTGLQYMFNPMDLFAGLIKSVAFGTIIFLLGYYHGLHSSGGAKGVGVATMKTVVSSCVSILIFDFILAILIFN